MLFLNKFDLATGRWNDTAIPFRNSLLEALFPDRDVAIVHASSAQPPVAKAERTDPRHKATMTRILANMETWQLDFASGARKHGDFFITRRADGPPISATFWSLSICSNSL